jgi:NADPH-dependent 2,4-dienoyl-CoA reductase/sulfur reductase-like enzyme/predicted acylesterase/phospholipase RssA
MLLPAAYVCSFHGVSLAAKCAIQTEGYRPDWLRVVTRYSITLDAHQMMEATKSMSDGRAGSRPQYVDFVLAGGGLASATAAETLRAADAAGSILMLSAERLPPYHRPPLSKRLLLDSEGEARIFIHPESFYRDRAIELRLNTGVLSVDASRQVVKTASGELGYGRLLIATGGIPNPLRVPGAELPGVFNLHDKGDADAIRQAASEVKRAVVIGGSFLGMEVALSLLTRGLEVTVIESGPILLRHLESASLSAYFKRYAENHGVAVLLNQSPVTLIGGDKVQEVETSSGQRLPCDLVVVAIGLAPASDFLAGSGIALDDGYIAVDALLRTSAPNVYAAGDVTKFYDPVFARRRHIEHWDNAVKQGLLAARNMLGQRLRYDEVSYFFSDVGDFSYVVLGAPAEADEWIERGSLDQRSYALFYLKNNVLRALFSIGRPAEETRTAERLIRYRTSLTAVKERLRDPAFALDDIPVQTALILQGGGALGAFECGVVKALEEEKIFPDIVAGVSIGAFNGAIIAANPRHATQALEAFWDEVAVDIPKMPLLASFFPEKATIAVGILAFGVPNFFRPRWLPPYKDLDTLPASWTSFYDSSPMKALIAKYVDFAALKTSPVRLLISAVNVTTGELEVFDSYVDDLTPNHVVASGSLPPALPWTIVDGKPYWDGGIVSNSPLDLLTERLGPDGKRIIIVDLFSGQRALPANMTEVIARRDEIVYAERIRSDLRYRQIINAYRALVEGMLGHLAPADAARMKQRPSYIQLMGAGAATTVLRLVRPTHEGEQASRDYDFSGSAVQGFRSEGYLVTKRELGRLGAGAEAAVNPALEVD